MRKTILTCDHCGEEVKELKTVLLGVGANTYGDNVGSFVEWPKDQPSVRYSFQLLSKEFCLPCLKKLGVLTIDSPVEKAEPVLTFDQALAKLFSESPAICGAIEDIALSVCPNRGEM